MIYNTDIHYMSAALSMAQRGLGRVWPNPSVGCVVVKKSVILASARTADGGRPHAETIALEKAGRAAKGASVYVTLEPCAHEGQTPPCTKALIDAGVRRVVIGARDVDPRVSGAGVRLLQEAGIDVHVGVLEKECKAMNAGFFLKMQKKRPLVTLKTACSLDGKVALKNGKSQWITGDLARRHVHLLRARHDAVLCGIGTVLADDPCLTARFDGIDHRPVRVVLDGDLETPLDSRLVKTARDVPLWLFHIAMSEEKERSLAKKGVRLFCVQEKAIAPILTILAEEGMTCIMVEGGRRIHTAFLKEGFCDALYLYRAPCVLGGDGLSAFGAMDIEDLAQRHNLSLQKTRRLGQDSLEIYGMSG